MPFHLGIFSNETPQEWKAFTGDPHDLVEDRSHSRHGRMVGRQCAVVLALDPKGPLPLDERRVPCLRPPGCRSQHDENEQGEDRGVAVHGCFMSWL